MASRRLATMGEGQFLLKNETKGTFYLNPLLNEQSGLKNQLARIAAEMGLSPTSRTRIQTSASKQPEAKGKGRFFKVVG